MALPQDGMSRNEIFARFDELAANDVRWRDGRVFSLAYSAGPDVLALAEDAYRRFSGENALNVDAFPSLRTDAGRRRRHRPRLARWHRHRRVHDERRHGEPAARR